MAEAAIQMATTAISKAMIAIWMAMPAISKGTARSGWA
jgi:hypothetical protein